MTTLIDPDRLNSVSRDDVARGAMSIIDAIQSLAPETQVIAATTVFLLLCDHRKVRPQGAFTTANNLMADAAGKRAEFRGLEAYMKHELT